MGWGGVRSGRWEWGGVREGEVRMGRSKRRRSGNGEE